MDNGGEVKGQGDHNYEEIRNLEWAVVKWIRIYEKSTQKIKYSVYKIKKMH